MTRKGLIHCKTKQPNQTKPIDGILTGPTTPDQNGPGSNGNEGVSALYQMQFSVVPRIYACGKSESEI